MGFRELRVYRATEFAGLTGFSQGMLFFGLCRLVVFIALIGFVGFAGAYEVHGASGFCRALQGFMRVYKLKRVTRVSSIGFVGACRIYMGLRAWLLFNPPIKV